MRMQPTSTSDEANDHQHFMFQGFHTSGSIGIGDSHSIGHQFGGCHNQWLPAGIGDVMKKAKHFGTHQRIVHRKEATRLNPKCPGQPFIIPVVFISVKRLYPPSGVLGEPGCCGGSPWQELSRRGATLMEAFAAAAETKGWGGSTRSGSCYSRGGTL